MGTSNKLELAGLPYHYKVYMC